MFITLLSVLLTVMDADTVVHELEEFTVVSQSRRNMQSSPLPQSHIDKSFLYTHFSSSLSGSLDAIAGVQAMSVGSSTSRPAIRGLGFNRLAVIHDGIRHEGQQWGNDHGLEIDQFAIDDIEVVKGPAALFYGSDAVAGALVLSSNRRPARPFSGEADMFFRSNNLLIGSSFRFEGMHKHFFWRLGATYQDYADYAVPTSSVQYYSYQIPLYKRRMRNTAGREADAAITLGYAGYTFHTCIKLFESFHKSGFFANAHGLEVRLSDIDYDRSIRDIDLPHQWVNHLKVLSHSVWLRDDITAELNVSWQHNVRQEHTEPVSHGYMPTPPSTLERKFIKHTVTANSNVTYNVAERHTLRIGASAEMQNNSRGGWGFVIPDFKTYAAGLFASEQFDVTENMSLIGGVRYDFSHIDISQYSDWYTTPINGEDAHIVRSQPVSRNFNSFTWTIGMTYAKNDWMLKVNIGKAFRTPIAKELGADGINYHVFRYEQGNPNLEPEKSYQADISVGYSNPKIKIAIDPYFNYFTNYIYLCPTSGYHEGLQLYAYSQSRVLRAGFEASVEYKPWRFLALTTQGEYLFARQLSGDKKGYSLPFTPPWSILAEVKYLFLLNKRGQEGEIGVNARITGRQRHIVPPEKITPSWWTLNINAAKNFETNKIKIKLSINAENILNKKYFNHTSFYRLIDVPEPGWNLSTMLRLQF